MLKNSSEGLRSLLMFVPVAGVDGCCRLPSQAAFESHSSILRHASDVTRPVCASVLHQCGNHYYAQADEHILQQGMNSSRSLCASQTTCAARFIRTCTAALANALAWG